MSIERIDNNYLVYADNANQVEKVQNGTVCKPVSIHEASKNKEYERVNNFENKSTCLSKQERVIKAQKLRARLAKVKENQAFIGNCWDGVKNFFGKDTGSEHVENQIKAFERGELSEEEIEKIFNEYKIGQEEVVDVTADIVSGIAAVGIYTAAVVATPFTGGASIAVGAAAATATGAAIKTGIKYADASAKGKEYDSVGYDLATGAFSGVLAPITGGMGGAVGKTVATNLGVQAISETGKAMTSNTLKAGTYNMLFNPTGYKYAGGSMLKRAAAFGTECAADGAVGGSVDNMFRASLNGEDIAEAGVNGFLGGLVLAPAIGGGIKGAGKVASSTTKKISGLLSKQSDIMLANKPAELQQATIIDQQSQQLEAINDTVELPARTVETSMQSVETFINELKQMKNKDGEPRFESIEIEELAGIVNKTNIPLIKEFAEITFKNGEPRFSGFVIAELAKNVTEINLPLIKELAEITFKNGEPRFSGFMIAELAKNVTEINLPLIKEFLQMTTKDGEPRFSSFDIARLAKNVTEINLPLIKEFLQIKTQDGTPMFDVFDMSDMFDIADLFNKKPEIIRTFLDMKNKDKTPKLGGIEIVILAKVTNNENFSLVCKLINDNLGCPEIICLLSAQDDPILKQLISDGDITKLQEKVQAQIKLMRENPQRYINDHILKLGHCSIDDILTVFFSGLEKNMNKAAAILDVDSLNNLMQMRLLDAEQYLDVLSSLSDSNLFLLKKLCEAKDINGKDFCGNQKIEFIDLINSYNDSGIPIDKMQKMAAEGKVNIEELNRDLFIKLMRDSGLSDEEIATISTERFKQWDLKLIHLLAKEIKSSRAPLFSDVFRLGNFSDNFKQAIHGTSTTYGKANVATRKMFEDSGMNYEKWVTPSEENNVHFVAVDKNLEQLTQIGTQLVEDIDVLRQSPYIKKHIDANFRSCIVDDKFVIPPYILSDKKQLAEFTTSLIEKLDKFWKMAQGNLAKPDRAEKAKNTLTILDHFRQRIKDIDAVSSSATTAKTIDLTIKMWDRDPQHDIFQGNYSTCCIGLGNGNGSAMPHYLMNTSYNMIELVDNTTGKTIGNALCFFVKGEDGKPIFIIDNIEINNAHKTSNEIGIQLRDAIAQYAANVTKEVTGADDIRICMGQSYNDVPINDLTATRENISFLGDVGIKDDDEIYMDLYGGWVEKTKFSNELTLLKLR